MIEFVYWVVWYTWVGAMFINIATSIRQHRAAKKAGYEMFEEVWSLYQPSCRRWQRIDRALMFGYTGVLILELVTR